MARKKKLFLGNLPIGGKVLKSRRKAREVTSLYHEIRNQLCEIDQANSTSETIKCKQQILLSSLDKIGGIDAYQKASVISTKYFNTSKWISKTLRKLIEEKSVTPKHPKPNVLEVGAINQYLSRQSWLQVRAIDINSQLPCIEETDFFDIAPEQSYDAVICSMVINCVPDPTKRGEMLCRLVEQIHTDGVLFLVLPVRCVDSPLLGTPYFESLLSLLGCTSLLAKRVTPKLVFYILGKHSTSYVYTQPLSSEHDYDASYSKKVGKTTEKSPDISAPSDVVNISFAPSSSLPRWVQSISFTIQTNLDKNPNTYEAVVKFFGSSSKLASNETQCSQYEISERSEDPAKRFSVNLPTFVIPLASL